MLSASEKYRNFIAASMNEKSVGELPGISETLAGRLIDAGYDKAYTVLGQYLLLKQNEEQFKNFLKETCNASSEQSSECFNCLQDWCEQFL